VQMRQVGNDEGGRGGALQRESAQAKLQTHDTTICTNVIICEGGI